MRSTRLFLIACGVTAAVLAAGAPAQASGPTGSAFAISVRATLLDSLKAGIGPLPRATYPAGADKSVVAVDVLTHNLARARVLNASATSADGVLTSEASIADVSVLGLVEAKLVAAECTSVGGVATGSSKLVDVTVAGTRIAVGARGSVTVGDLVRVHVNEQVRAGGKLTVNALRVSVGGKVGGVARADVILGQAVCSGAEGDGDNGDNGGGVPTTTTPAAPTTPGDGTPSTTPADPSTTPAPGEDSASPTAPVPAPGITPVAGEEDLADTGVSAVVPLSLGGLALLAAGGGALYAARRRARA